jgi:hypothetical protein
MLFYFFKFFFSFFLFVNSLSTIYFLYNLSRSCERVFVPVGNDSIDYYISFSSSNSFSCFFSIFDSHFFIILSLIFLLVFFPMFHISFEKKYLKNKFNVFFFFIFLFFFVVFLFIYFIFLFNTSILTDMHFDSLKMFFEFVDSGQSGFLIFMFIFLFFFFCFYFLYYYFDKKKLKGFLGFLFLFFVVFCLLLLVSIFFFFFFESDCFIFRRFGLFILFFCLSISFFKIDAGFFSFAIPIYFILFCLYLFSLILLYMYLLLDSDTFLVRFPFLEICVKLSFMNISFYGFPELIFSQFDCLVFFYPEFSSILLNTWVNLVVDTLFQNIQANHLLETKAFFDLKQELIYQLSRQQVDLANKRLEDFIYFIYKNQDFVYK